MKQIFLSLIIFIGFVILFSSCQNQTQDNQDRKQVEVTKENLEDREMIEEIGTSQQDNPIIDKDYFKKFDRIELAYYPHSVRSYGAMPKCSKLIKEGGFVVDSLQKKVTLNEAQIEELEKIVFTNPVQKEWQPADCFFPRHSLIFYKQKKATHIIEICFECSEICYSQYEYTGMYLELKFDEMENLFNKILKK